MFENLYAPYPYPYAAQQQPVMQQQQQKVPIVSGESGVRSEQLAPDSSKLYLDESGSKLWVAVTNNLGVKSVSCYDIIPYQEKPAPDYSALEQRITKLEERYGYSESTKHTEQRTDRNQPNQGVREQSKSNEQS